MQNRVIGPDSPLLRWMSMLSDFLFLSILWLLCSLPVITFVPATIALYDSVVRCVKGDEGGTYRRFFRTLKKELGRGILLSLLWLALAAVLIFGCVLMYLNAMQTENGSTMALAYLISLFVPLSAFCWLIPLESRYVYRFWELHKMAFLFTVTALPYTVGIVALLLLGAAACFFFPPAILFVPGLLACLQSLCIERGFKKYLHTEEDGSHD